LNLAFGHARTKLVNHVLGYDVTLLDINFVHAGKVSAAAGGKKRDGEQCGAEFGAKLCTVIHVS